jgi:hypothetical protein
VVLEEVMYNIFVAFITTKSARKSAVAANNQKKTKSKQLLAIKEVFTANINGYLGLFLNTNFPGIAVRTYQDTCQTGVADILQKHPCGIIGGVPAPGAIADHR